LLGVLVLTFSGFSIIESSFEVISSQSNVGLSVGITDQSMPLASKIMLIINMWVGRLEIIPVLSVLGIIFSRKYHV
jgi:trk system potassium uptake protein TrkH